KVVGGVKKLFRIGSPSKLFADFGGWLGEGLVIGIDGSLRSVEKSAEGMADAATPDLDMSYDTPDGAYSTLNRSISGSVDVESRDSRLIGAISSLERRLGDLEVVMDERTVGRILSPHINENNSRRDKSINRAN